MRVEVCEEMKKLRKWLDEQGIQWFDDSDDPEIIGKKYQICRTKFEIGNYDFSVIHGFGTYGGKWYYDGEFFDKDLLECRSGNHEPVGWLTAEDVIERIKEMQK